MTGTPEDRLPRLIRDGATFVRALGAEGEQLIVRLQNDHALSAHRHDDKFVLLQLGGFIAGQMRWSGRTGLRQRLEITNDRIGDAGQPAEDARAQEKIDESDGAMSANWKPLRRVRSISDLLSSTVQAWVQSSHLLADCCRVKTLRARPRWNAR